jgi:hypothetical protein
MTSFDIEATRGAPAILDGWMPSGYVDPIRQRILLTELGIGY